jgi:hypothetical protein
MTNNLDRTDLRIVRKGCTIRAEDGRHALVVKTSRGSCLVRYEGHRYAVHEYCRDVTVIDTGVKRRELTPQQREQARELRQRIAVLHTAKCHASADALRVKLRNTLANQSD